MNNNRPIRLHKFVTQTLKKAQNTNYSQPEIQKNIERYGIIVDGNLTNKRLDWVFEYQVIQLNNWPIRETGNLSEIVILEEKKDYLVVFKPPNLAVQPGIGHQKDNLVCWLLERYPEQEKLLYQSSYFTKLEKNFVPTNPVLNPTAGLVHRLDKDAQGLLLVARNLQILDFFQDQFRLHTAIKKYLIVVDGLMINQIYVNTWQARDKRNPVKQKLFFSQLEAINYDPKAREATSIFTPIINCPQTMQSLVEVEIRTGRMHQIRLQAESLGFPLTKDPIYNTNVVKISKNQLSNLHNSSPSISIKNYENKLINLNKENFVEYKNKLFGNVDFCLLSNHLTVKYKKRKIEKTLYQINLDELIDKQNFKEK